MRERFQRGIELIADLPELGPVAAAISFQHDHFDGRGPMNTLAGKRIPLYSRILAIANAYDEMRQPVNGAPAFSHEEAELVLRAAAGRRFDPQLVSLFCRSIDGVLEIAEDTDMRSALALTGDYETVSDATH